MIEFYSPELVTTESLPTEESQHCIKVLRKKEGDEIMVVDGKGERFLCRITDANPKSVTVKIIKSENISNHWNGKIVLAVAPTKNMERMEWLIEKAVEIGVDEVIFLDCKRSERKKMKTERLERIAVSAMKQSLKAKLPMITELMSFKDFILGCGQYCQKIMAYCGDECELTEFTDVYKKEDSTIILIGPEGDFSPEEVKMALSSGFKGVTFGDCRLRTETAALYGLTAIHVLNKVKSGCFPV